MAGRSRVLGECCDETSGLRKCTKVPVFDSGIRDGGNRNREGSGSWKDEIEEK